MSKYLQTMEAMRLLAGCCDGARMRDNTGFNAADSHVGKQLAAKSLTDGWTKSQMVTAIKMLQKYRGQIESSGLVLPKVREVVKLPVVLNNLDPNSA